MHQLGALLAASNQIPNLEVYYLIKQEVWKKVILRADLWYSSLGSRWCLSSSLGLLMVARRLQQLWSSQSHTMSDSSIRSKKQTSASLVHLFWSGAKVFLEASPSTNFHLHFTGQIILIATLTWALNNYQTLL